MKRWTLVVLFAVVVTGQLSVNTSYAAGFDFAATLRAAQDRFQSIAADINHLNEELQIEILSHVQDKQDSFTIKSDGGSDSSVVARIESVSDDINDLESSASYIGSNLSSAASMVSRVQRSTNTRRRHEADRELDRAMSAAISDLADFSVGVNDALTDVRDLLNTPISERTRAYDRAAKSLLHDSTRLHSAAYGLGNRARNAASRLERLSSTRRYARVLNVYGDRLGKASEKLVYLARRLARTEGPPR